MTLPGMPQCLGSAKIEQENSVMNYIIDMNHPTKTSHLEQAVHISSRDIFKMAVDVEILVLGITVEK